MEMEKIIVHLTVPAVSCELDMYIPGFVSIRELTGLIVRAVEDISNHQYQSSGKEVLCYKEQDQVLAQEPDAQFYGIQNGDHLFLI